VFTLPKIFNYLKTLNFTSIPPGESWLGLPLADKLYNSGKSFNLSYSFHSLILLLVMNKTESFMHGYKLSSFSI